MDLKGRNFLTLKDFTPEEITYMLDLAAESKRIRRKKVFRSMKLQRQECSADF